MQLFKSWSAAGASRLDALDASGLSPLHRAAKDGSTDLLSSLLERGATVGLRSETGKTALHYAALNGRNEALTLLLATPNVEIDAKDSNGRTPLQDAAFAGHDGAAGLLFREGASLLLRDQNGRCAVDLAAEYGHLPVLEALEREGVHFGTLRNNGALLHLAALSGQAEIVRYLTRKGIDVDAIFNDMTALSRSIQLDSTEVTEALLHAGASVDVAAPGSPNLLALAVLKGHAATVQLLLDFSADPLRLVNNLGVGISPLQAAIECAVKGGNKSIIDLLLDTEASITVSEPGGSPSAIQLCRLHGRRDLAQKLLNSYHKVQATRTEQDLDLFMDILPPISKPFAYAPVRVPLLLPLKQLEDPSIYMKQYFGSFNTLMSWTLDEKFFLRRVGPQKESVPLMAGFLQEWLFFGILKAISQAVEFEYSPRQFLRRAQDGTRFLCTIALTDFLENWREAETSLQSHAASLVENNPSFQDAAILSIVARLCLINDYLQRAEVVLARASYPKEMENDTTTLDPGSESATSDPRSESEAQDLFDRSILASSILCEILTSARDKYYSAHCRLEADKMSSDSRVAVSARRFEASGALLEDYDEAASGFVFPTRFTFRRMIKNKWCRSDVYMMHSLRLRVSTLYFVSLIDRPCMKTGHDDCSRFKCQVMQVDESNYRTLHLTDECTCKHVSVDIDSVRALLDKGEYPVLQIVEGENLDDLSISVSSGKDHVYVAFSHVWGQGMGNPHANSLPACQLRHLGQLARTALNELDERSGDLEVAGESWGKIDGIFWLDTLCVPLEKNGRKKALRLLRNAYDKALFVIALDSELYTASVNCTHAEKIGRVLLSPWMRRLWTLQEGLSNSAAGLVYQFSEKALSNGVDIGGLNQSYSSVIEEDISMDLGERLRTLLPPRWNLKYTSGHKLLNVLQASCYRSTSKTEDEVRCLASLLQLDTNKLEDVSDSDEEMRLQNRLRVFYEMLGDETRLDVDFYGIPLNVLFMEGPRLNIPRFTWAPFSFLSREPSDILTRQDDYPLAFVCGDGLRVEMEGWLFDSSDQDMFHIDQKPVALIDEDKDTAFIVTRYGDEWKSPPPSAPGRSFVLLREPKMTPHALLVVADKANDNGTTTVNYGWRVEAVHWKLADFRQSLQSGGEIKLPTLDTSAESGIDEEHGVTKLQQHLSEMRLAFDASASDWTNDGKTCKCRKSDESTWIIV